jgi:fluoride exporter
VPAERAVTALAVVLGGAAGAPLRYTVELLIRTRYQGMFPWGTVLVNVAGSLLLGCVLGAAPALPAAVVPLLGTGFCGALTTFSAFGYETLRLLEDGAVGQAALNAVGSVLLGTFAAAIGFAVGHALT